MEISLSLHTWTIVFLDVEDISIRTENMAGTNSVSIENAWLKTLYRGIPVTTEILVFLVWYISLINSWWLRVIRKEDNKPAPYFLQIFIDAIYVYFIGKPKINLSPQMSYIYIFTNSNFILMDTFIWVERPIYFLTVFISNKSLRIWENLIQKISHTVGFETASPTVGPILCFGVL